MPKAHKIFQNLLFTRVINPKVVQNHCEEALFGTVTNTWKRSISGRMFQANVPTKRIVALLSRFALPIDS